MIQEGSFLKISGCLIMEELVGLNKRMDHSLIFASTGLVLFL